MVSRRRTYRLGTRGSRLALWQARHVRERLLAGGPLRDIEIVRVRTRGDADRTTPISRLGGKGVFVREIEVALLRGEIDFAVHSLKDMTARLAPELLVAARIGGAARNDSFLSRNRLPLDEVPPGARIGTGSPRRRAQLLHLRPDIRVVPIRGNVPTRARKMGEGEYDGLVLARAGLERLGLDGLITQDLDPGEMVPAAGQGVIAVEARGEDLSLIEALRSVNDGDLEALTEIELSFVRELGLGCREPVGVLAERSGGDVMIRYFVGQEASAHYLRGRHEGGWEKRSELGKILADRARKDWYDRFGEELPVPG